MPTTRPRHLVTETEALAAVLDAAAERWPGVSRPQLLVRLALEGGRSVRWEDDDRRRLAALRRHRGALTGAYGSDYLHELRKGWPA